MESRNGRKESRKSVRERGIGASDLEGIGVNRSDKVAKFNVNQMFVSIVLGVGKVFLEEKEDFFSATFFKIFFRNMNGEGVGLDSHDQSDDGISKHIVGWGGGPFELD